MLLSQNAVFGFCQTCPPLLCLNKSILDSSWPWFLIAAFASDSWRMPPRLLIHTATSLIHAYRTMDMFAKPLYDQCMTLNRLRITSNCIQHGLTFVPLTENPWEPLHRRLTSLARPFAGSLNSGGHCLWVNSFFPLVLTGLNSFCQLPFCLPDHLADPVLLPAPHLF